jgi:hypothetical protein
MHAAGKRGLSVNHQQGASSPDEASHDAPLSFDEEGRTVLLSVLQQLACMSQVICWSMNLNLNFNGG